MAKDFKRTAKKVRARYLSVNIWRTHFGPISVAAVYDVYSQKLNIPHRDAKKLDFTDCVDKLRQLENPEYIPHAQRKQ
tara:strand:- start:264 stop:497 length:234 start_codon:yes stop_codon:yes gene_type:complete